MLDLLSPSSLVKHAIVTDFGLRELAKPVQQTLPEEAPLRRRC